MFIRSTILAATVASLGTLATLSAAQADGVHPMQAASIDLGNVSGVTYYTVDRDNFRVVTTLVQGDNGTPVRIVADLAPGQSMIFSVPSEAGATPAAAVEISRHENTLRVREAVDVTNYN
jgi:hypothetical protein